MNCKSSEQCVCVRQCTSDRSSVHYLILGNLLILSVDIGSCGEGGEKEKRGVGGGEQGKNTEV